MNKRREKKVGRLLKEKKDDCRSGEERDRERNMERMEGKREK